MKENIITAISSAFGLFTVDIEQLKQENKKHKIPHLDALFDLMSQERTSPKEIMEALDRSITAIKLKRFPSDLENTFVLNVRELVYGPMN